MERREKGSKNGKSWLKAKKPIKRSKDEAYLTQCFAT